MKTDPKAFQQLLDMACTRDHQGELSAVEVAIRRAYPFPTETIVAAQFKNARPLYPFTEEEQVLLREHFGYPPGFDFADLLAGLP